MVPKLQYTARLMPLSYNAVLVYVLHNGVAGRLASGRIERADNGLAVYTGPGMTLNEYISGPKIRSWCVLGLSGQPLAGWIHVLPEDQHKVSG
jgi:hypothetical protein